MIPRDYFYLVEWQKDDKPCLRSGVVTQRRLWGSGAAALRWVLKDLKKHEGVEPHQVSVLQFNRV